MEFDWNLIFADDFDWISENDLALFDLEALGASASATSPEVTEPKS